MSPYQILDRRFEALIIGHARLERLWTGSRWAEGPVYVPAAKSLIWSDIPEDRLMRYDETDGSVSVFEHPCGYHNGHTLDREGRIVACEHGGRRVTRTEHDGTITVLADRYDGKPLNSPNDVVVRSDGTVFFSDPSYGIEGYYEGFAAEPEQAGQFLFRLTPDGTLTVAADDMQRPNGLAFSPDERILYVSDTGTKTMRAYDVAPDGTLSDSREFARCTAGGFDGFRLDEQGHIWSSAGDGVHVLHPDGTLLGKVKVPEGVANVQWGGYKRNRLYICATTSLYAILLPVRGAKTM